MAKATPQGFQLPNAPLVEVVFELRWKLKGEEGVPEQLMHDPGYHVMADEFLSQTSRLGFSYPKRLVPDNALLSGYSIEWRIHRSEKDRFPLIQIGPGIFAANESVGYVWSDYKKMCLSGLRLLFKSRPKLKSFEFVPSVLELRYTDSFATEDPSTNDLTRFINTNTALKVTLPPFCSTPIVSAPQGGQVSFSFPVKGNKGTEFGFVVSNAEINKLKSIALLSKVTSKIDGNTPKSSESLVSYIDRWLESAHAITSPFFKQFVSEKLMKAFERPRNG